jgi:Na+/proline symporter/serine phosphatase RsbU (regulator of sigma subunit)
MIPVYVVTLTSIIYFGILFGVAYYADRLRKQGRSMVDNHHIYSLSLAVYCTSWTFYGSVGRAATTGIDFLTIYLGPTLIAFSWWFLLRKIVRISKKQNIASIADFISSRYGKSAWLGAIVTIFAVLGIMPYIALQLKAVARTFDLLVSPLSANNIMHVLPQLDLHFDTALVVAMILALFGVLFGARHLDTSERHEGLVAAIALESVVKIFAFIAAGIFVTYGLFDGFNEIFNDFLTRFPEREQLLRIGTGENSYAHWFTMTVISMMAVMFLPRQFHIMVIENCREEHIRSAMWRLPAYLFAINLFVIPIALGGLLLTNGDTHNADFFVVTLPLQYGQPWLALLVFIGGFSASAGMVMISSVALSTMILNHLLIPLILKFQTKSRSLSTLLLNLKRLGIIGVIALGYLYYRLLGESAALVNIGLISFVAATQFAPAVIGGLYWRQATRRGATVGLIMGFVVWFYTLLVPSFADSGWLDTSIIENGLFGLSLLKPTALFGLSGFDIWTHALFWTMFVNLGSYLAISLLTSPSDEEVEQIRNFVDVYKPPPSTKERTRITKSPTVIEFVDLMAKFIGKKQAHNAISNYLGGQREIDEKGSLSEYELPKLKRFTELTLAGSVGVAPARTIVDKYLSARGSHMEDVFDLFGSINISRAASREQLSVLYDAAKAVASGKELQAILDEILKIFTDQFKFDLCVIRILDEDRQTLTVRSQRGMTSEHFGESERDLTSDTFIGETYLTNRITMVNDCDYVSKPKTAKIIRREKILSFAHAPIAVEGQPIGVLSSFSRTSKGIFTNEFVELFASIAGQVGIAWRNAQQTERLIQAREQQKELAIAKNIQLGLLPTSVPDVKGVALGGICLPAKEVGGDYYDYLLNGDDRLDLVIADVSGHNVGAALIMAEARTMIRSQSEQFRDPQRLLEELNKFFYDDLTRAELFITLFYLQYHPETRKISFASAGHSPALVWQAKTKRCIRLDPEGLIIGVKKDFPYEQDSLQLAEGDVLLLYTDGLIEAENTQNEFFGEGQLADLLGNSVHLPPQELINKIIEQAQLFTGHKNFQDDVSMIVMKIE